MAVSPARLAAFEILLKIDAAESYSSELLHSERLAALSRQDRALAMEIVMGVLRWRSWLDAGIARYSFTPFRKLDPEVLTALRVGVYQLQFLERVPARAAINESVDLVKHARKASAAPLTNAILRKVPKTGAAERAALHAALGPEFGAGSAESEALASLLEYEDPDQLARRLATDFAHPEWMVRRWISHYGAARAVSVCRFDQQVPVTALRLGDVAAEAELRAEGIELAPGALLASARRVLYGDPTRTRAYAEGRVTIQDEGSQLVAALVGRGMRILDCCAAPGGKTTALAERNPEADILAADLHEHRVRLMRRLVRAANVRIIQADARSLPVGGEFDRILADVPCSGTGTLARNPEIKWRLAPQDLPGLHTRQLAILRAALSHLAAGGRLVYSTCSLEPEENEAVIGEVLEQLGADPSSVQAAPEAVAASPSRRFRLISVGEQLSRLEQEGKLSWRPAASLTSGIFLRTLPGLQPCDGFFAAIIERTR